LANHPLDRFSAIYLANIGQLDERAVTALEDYVRRGGGLAIFAGEGTDPRFVNERLYRDGKGLFPLPIGNPAQLFVDRLEKAADLEVADHPIFKVFAGERNSFLGAVAVERYFTTRRGHEAPTDSTVRVIAQLRNGAPLAVEHKFGDGHV